MRHQGEIKAEQIARMIVAGLPKTHIAEEMQMSYIGLMTLVKTPEYLQIEEAVRRELVGKMDARLDKRARMERDLEDALPEAMQVLLDHVREKRDLRAALEVFDRDPAHQFVKASRTASNDSTPSISSEALATAVKEADWTHKIMQQAPNPAEA